MKCLFSNCKFDTDGEIDAKSAVGENFQYIKSYKDPLKSLKFRAKPKSQLYRAATNLCCGWGNQLIYIIYVSPWLPGSLSSMYLASPGNTACAPQSTGSSSHLLTEFVPKWVGIISSSSSILLVFILVFVIPSKSFPSPSL